MKIISGILKGRKIEVNNKLEYRPTLSRIREDIFNILLHNPNITFDKKIVTLQMFTVDLDPLA